MSRRPRFRVIMFGLPAIAAVSAIGAVLSMTKSIQSQPIIVSRQPSPAGPAPRDQGEALRSVLIGAAGIIEPSGQETRIGTSISGAVETIFVEPGARVKSGDPLFIIDRRLMEAALQQKLRDLRLAQARLSHARAKLAGLDAEVRMSLAAIEAALAERDEASAMVHIADQLKGSSAMSEREAARRRSVLRANEARLKGAQAQLALIEANRSLFMEGEDGALIEIEKATVEQASAAVALALTELELRIVRAPIDGTILQVNVRAGEHAQAGSAVQPLVVMGRLEPLHVRVDIDETDIPRYQSGAAAMASLRGAAERSLQLKFVRLEPLIVPKRALTGQATERVDTRVMQAIYAIESAHVTVHPGQQVDVFIDTGSRPVNTTMAR
jgi:HlyD family secretion protein